MVVFVVAEMGNSKADLRVDEKASLKAAERVSSWVE